MEKHRAGGFPPWYPPLSVFEFLPWLSSAMDCDREPVRQIILSPPPKLLLNMVFITATEKHTNPESRGQVLWCPGVMQLCPIATSCCCVLGAYSRLHSLTQECQITILNTSRLFWWCGSAQILPQAFCRRRHVSGNCHCRCSSTTRKMQDVAGCKQVESQGPSPSDW